MFARTGLLFFLVCLSSARAAQRIQIACFSSVLGEIAQEVGGQHVNVFQLIPAGVDPHQYDLTPSDLKAVSQSQLVLAAGAEQENNLRKLNEAGNATAPLLQVDNILADASAGPIDRHWWHRITKIKEATKLVRDELSKLDPADAPDFAANAAAYSARLEELEKWMKRKLAELPRDRRKLVTSHDAFQFLARDFGFTILALEGPDTGSETSSRHVAALIDAMKRDHVKTIFVESTLNPKVMEEITRETGAKIGGRLEADGLGRGDASTYIGMMKHNVTMIVDALR